MFWILIGVMLISFVAILIAALLPGPSSDDSSLYTPPDPIAPPAPHVIQRLNITTVRREQLRCLAFNSKFQLIFGDCSSSSIHGTWIYDETDKTLTNHVTASQQSNCLINPNRLAGSEVFGSSNLNGCKGIMLDYQNHKIHVGDLFLSAWSDDAPSWSKYLHLEFKFEKV